MPRLIWPANVLGYDFAMPSPITMSINHNTAKYYLAALTFGMPFDNGKIESSPGSKFYGRRTFAKCQILLMCLEYLGFWKLKNS